MEADSEDSVAAWWDMVVRNLRSCPQSCSALGRKIACMYNDFTSKSLKDRILPPFMDMIIFLNIFKAPFLLDLKRPELKIPHTVNFYIKCKPKVILGIWHTVPSCRGEDSKDKDRCWYEMALQDGNPIIIYLHGSAEHRGAPHRIKTVKVLSDGGFHVLSVDYRGFGDSTGCPADAIILEAPFTNMWVATINYPLLKIYRNSPRCIHNLMDSMTKDKIVFPNDENVKWLSSPLLILHCEDDKTVPVEFGKKVYEIAHCAYKNKERVEMHIFPPGFQHNLLCKSPELVKTVRDFLSRQWA